LSFIPFLAGKLLVLPKAVAAGKVKMSKVHEE
jgi:hypothetical protein